MDNTSPYPHPSQVKDFIEKVHESGIYNLLGMRIMEIRPGYSRLRIEFRKELTHPGGVAHGGVMATLADASVACALFPLLGPDQWAYSTIEMKLNYFRPFLEGEMIAEGKIIQKGKTIGVGEIDIHDGKDTLYGKGIATYKL